MTDLATQQFPAALAPRVSFRHRRSSGVVTEKKISGSLLREYLNFAEVTELLQICWCYLRPLRDMQYLKYVFGFLFLPFRELAVISNWS